MSTDKHPADVRLEWCEKYIKVKGKRQFEVLGIPERGWVRDFFRALEGFKTWPANDNFEDLCGNCKNGAELLIDHPDDIYELTDCRASRNDINEFSDCGARGSESVLHRGRSDLHVQYTDDSDIFDRRVSGTCASSCPGLIAEPILFIFLAGDRRTGKSASWFAAAIEAASNEKGFDALYLATTDDQTQELSADHCVKTIEANRMLEKKWRLAPSQNRYAVPGKRSSIRVSAPTMKAAGKGVELLGIDEAREFPGQILAVILPTIQDTHGTKCMKCRHKIYGDTRDSSICEEDGCGGKRRRFYGRAVFASNAAIIKDDPERDWYADIIRSFTHEGTPKNVWVFNLDDAAKHNPDVAQETKSASIELMKRAPGLRPFIASEFENRDTRAGEDWLADYEIDSAVDKHWQPIDRATNPVIGFFDTADVTDLCSILLLEDMTKAHNPESKIRYDYVRIDECVIWDPKDPECPVVTEGTIDEHKAEEAIIELLYQYPTLQYFGVDTRWRPWAQRMVKRLQRDKKRCPFGHKIHAFDGWGEERNIGWSELQTKITSGRLPLPPIGRLISELKNARVVLRKGYVQVREQNKRILHLDVAENLATCCYYCHMLGSRHVGSFRKSNPNSASVKNRSGRYNQLRTGFGKSGRFRS